MATGAQATFTIQVPDEADALSNRLVFCIHALGLYRAWQVLDVAGRCHIVGVLLACCLAETLRMRFQQTYQRWRHVLATSLVILVQVGPGGWQLYYALLNKTISNPTIASLAPYLVYLLCAFFFFNRPWQLPLIPHLVSSLLVFPAAMVHNASVCDTDVMVTNHSHEVTRYIFSFMALAHQWFAPGAALTATKLSTRAQCITITNTLTVLIGFLLPTVLIAANEADRYHQLTRNAGNSDGTVTVVGVSRIRSSLYHILGSFDETDRVRLIISALIALHISWTLHIAVLNQEL